jgi:HK97 family phage portal protein
MGFLDQLIRGAEYRSVTSTLANPSMWLADAFGSSKTSSGQRVTAQKAIGLAPVWAAVSFIAESGIGMLPFKVYRTLPNTDGEVVVAEEHRAWRMLHNQPNPITPANRFWSTVTVHLLLWGNAFLVKVRSDLTGLVEELWLLDPSTVTVEWNGFEKRFVEQTASGQRNQYSGDDVLHITGLSMNGLIGESVISRCRNTLGTALAREEFEGGFYGRGATIRGFIQHPQRIGDDAIKNLRESWTAIFGGTSKAHQTAVLEEGATYQAISMPMSDMEFVAAQQLSRTDIAVMFKLPPSYLGGSTGDSLTYATVEANQIQFAQNAVAPWANTIAKAVGADPGIFPFQSWYPEFVLEGLMRGDHNARAGFYTAMFNLKDDEGRRAMSVDEIRAKENMSPAETPPQPTPQPAPPQPNPAPPQPQQINGRVLTG